MKILLLQLKRIGDLILTTPAFAALRKEFPDAQLTLIISGECADLVPAISNVDRIRILQRSLSDAATFLNVIREKFDFCVDFTRNDRSGLLTFLSGARKRIVSEGIKNRSKTRARVYNEFVEHRMRDMPTLDYNLALLEPLGIQNASRKLHLDLPGSVLEKANALRGEAQIQTPFIAFHPGSARGEKLWEPERWAEVIDHARSNGQVSAVLTGGASELEQNHIREIKSKLREPAIDLSGRTDLLVLAALISQARMLVTVDSAPMHLAAATNTPQVVLFGPTNPFHWRPRESPALILQGGSGTRVVEFSPYQSPVPMKQISTQAVIDAMESLLSTPAAQPAL